MGKFVGIDLGTTYSVVAYINAEGKAEVIKNEHGYNLTPSVIYFGESAPIVGDEAKARQGEGATEIASFFKRSMGNTAFLLSFHGQDYTPIDLSALVLRYLKEQAERFFGEPVTDAVITVPAYFEDIHRKATIEAGRKAGLDVLKIISEPTAAALAYGVRPGPSTQRLLVYDLGGGTFDVSLVEITPDVLRVEGTDGDHELGGKNWDDRLLAYLSTRIQQEYGLELIGDDFNELRVKAEQLKRSLSLKLSADIRLQIGGRWIAYTVTREKFEELTKDLMERTQLLTEQVLRDKHLSWSNIQGVLPVGGSTRMPMVADYIQRMTGKPPMTGIHQDEAVALGAAMQALMEMETKQGASAPLYHLAGRKTTIDVIAHSLGLIAENADRSRYINSILIQKNLPIPSHEARPYQKKVRQTGNDELEVFLTQSESEDPQQCIYLGRYVFSDFPKLKDKTAILDITYEYDKNGTVHISAVEKSTGTQLKLTEYPVPPDVPARFAGRPIDLVEAREHLTVYLVIDTSSSMSGHPLHEAKRAAGKFVDHCDLTRTSIGLISFESSVNVVQQATQNNKKIHQAIEGLYSDGGTSGDSFTYVYNLLHKVEGIRYAIVLTDGQWGGQDTAIRMAKQCHEAGIQVIAIGFGQADSHFLQQIASSSEQGFLTDMHKLTETFSTIAQELTASPGTPKRWKK